MKLFMISLLCSVITFHKCLCGRIYFEKCNYKGFTCHNTTVVNDPQEITYQCTESYGQDVTIHLWQFIKPSTKSTLLIKNCQTVRFYFGCTFDTKNDLIQLLHIQNVRNLQFIPAALSHNPPTIIFENITNIEAIPTGSFSQIKYKSFKPGCFNPTADLDSIVFQNVKIDTIEAAAFENLTHMKYFRWENVSVKTIKAGGMKIAGGKDLNMQILTSEFGVLEPLAIQVSGEKLILLGSIIKEVRSSGLNGMLDTFDFSYNWVKSVQSGAFCISAHEVDITANHFDHLQFGALQKISPRIIGNTAERKLTYSFRQNFIKHVDAGGLHPDVLAYKNGAGDVTFFNNSLQCTCDGLAWLGADVHLGVGYYPVKDFHKMVLAVQNNNTCAFAPCKLPLASIRKLVLPNGKCNEISEAKICTLYKPEEFTEGEIASNLGSLKETVNVMIVFPMLIFRLTKT